jgi:transposase-like protein
MMKINPVSILSWIQKYKSKKIPRKKKIEDYIIDETAIKTGSELILLWIVIEPKDSGILGMSISKERKICLLQIVFYLEL